MDFTRPRHETKQPIGQGVLVETKSSFVRSFIGITLTLIFLGIHARRHLAFRERTLQPRRRSDCLVEGDAERDEPRHP